MHKSSQGIQMLKLKHTFSLKDILHIMGPTWNQLWSIQLWQAGSLFSQTPKYIGVHANDTHLNFKWMIRWPDFGGLCAWSADQNLKSFRLIWSIKGVLDLLQ